MCPCLCVWYQKGSRIKLLYTQQIGWISKASCLEKEVGLKMLHTIQFHVCDVLEKTRLWWWRRDQWLPGYRGREWVTDYKGAAGGMGWRACAVLWLWYLYMERCTTNKSDSLCDNLKIKKYWKGKQCLDYTVTDHRFSARHPPPPPQKVATSVLRALETSPTGGPLPCHECYSAVGCQDAPKVTVCFPLLHKTFWSLHLCSRLTL